MQAASLRAYKIFLGLISAIYAGIVVLSFSALLIGIVSASIVQNPEPQFRTKATMVFCSIATLPIACIAAIIGAWALFYKRRYMLALLPLTLPFFSIAAISFTLGMR